MLSLVENNRVYHQSSVRKLDTSIQYSSLVSRSRLLNIFLFKNSLNYCWIYPFVEEWLRYQLHKKGWNELFTSLIASFEWVSIGETVEGVYIFQNKTPNDFWWFVEKFLSWHQKTTFFNLFKTLYKKIHCIFPRKII